eukprot:1159989-Pelagomonas_calceolata.AAC.4
MPLFIVMPVRSGKAGSASAWSIALAPSCIKRINLQKVAPNIVPIWLPDNELTVWTCPQHLSQNVKHSKRTSDDTTETGQI